VYTSTAVDTNTSTSWGVGMEVPNKCSTDVLSSECLSDGNDSFFQVLREHLKGRETLRSEEAQVAFSRISRLPGHVLDFLFLAEYPRNAKDRASPTRELEGIYVQSIANAVVLTDQLTTQIENDPHATTTPSVEESQKGTWHLQIGDGYQIDSSPLRIYWRAYGHCVDVLSPVFMISVLVLTFSYQALWLSTVESAVLTYGTQKLMSYMWSEELPSLRPERSLFQLSCVVSLLVYSFGIFITVLLPELTRHTQMHTQVLCGVIGSSFMVGTVFFAIAHHKDPGFLPLQAPVSDNAMETVGSPMPDLHPSALSKDSTKIPQSICSTCKVDRPVRSKHCGVCRRCVSRFDHHCPVIDNCVGAKNQREYCIFISSFFVGQVCYMVASFIVLLQVETAAEAHGNGVWKTGFRLYAGGSKHPAVVVLMVLQCRH